VYFYSKFNNNFLVCYLPPQILQQIKSAVRATDPGATHILFGSYARGDNHKDSDIYLLVLLNNEKITNDYHERIGYPLYEIQLQENILISPVIYSKNTWDTRLKMSPFYKNVTKEGIFL